MKLLRYGLGLGIAALLLFGCGSDGGSDEPEKQSWLFEALHLTLDGDPNPEDAGLLTAYKLDYFGDFDVGLDITAPLDPTRPVQYVTNRSVDVAVTHEPQVVLAQEQGAPVVMVGSLVSQPTLAMISLAKSKIESVADLKGRTVAIPGAPFQRLFLEALLEDAGLALSDVTLERVDDEMVPELISGRADVLFGGSANVEGAALESRGLKPVVIGAKDLGLPPYNELVVIARKDRVAKEPELFSRIMSAVRQGTTAAVEDPRAATEAIRDISYAEASQKPRQEEVEATLPVLSRTGRLSPETAEELIAWMHEQGLIQRQPQPSEMIAGEVVSSLEAGSAR